MWKAGVLLLAIVALHFSANAFGIYDAQIAAGNVWFDNLLHVLVGLAFALLWVGISKQEGKSFGYVAITTLAFVVAVAVLWELCELGFYLLAPVPALELKIYSPSIGESVEDILSNLGGAVLFVLWRFVRR